MKLKAPLLSFLAFALVLASLSSAKAQTVIRFGYGAHATQPALFVAMDKGYFKKEGIEVKFLPFPVIGHVLRALAARELDIGVLSGPGLATAVGRGVKVVAVAEASGMDDPPVSYITMADSGIKKVEDLKGKSIGIVIGGNFDMNLRYMLEKHGLDPKKDITMVEMSLPETVRSLGAKKIDAGAVNSQYLVMAKGMYGDKVRVIFTYKDIDVYKEVAFSSLIIVAERDFLAKNREAVKKFLEGYLQGVKFYKDNFAEAREIIFKSQKSPEIRELGPSVLRYDAKIDARSLQHEADLLFRYGILKGRLNMADFLDHSLVEEIAAAQR